MKHWLLVLLLAVVYTEANLYASCLGEGSYVFGMASTGAKGKPRIKGDDVTNQIFSDWEKDTTTGLFTRHITRNGIRDACPMCSNRRGMKNAIVADVDATSDMTCDFTLITSSNELDAAMIKCWTSCASVHDLKISNGIITFITTSSCGGLHALGPDRAKIETTELRKTETTVVQQWGILTSADGVPFKLYDAKSNRIALSFSGCVHSKSNDEIVEDVDTKVIQPVPDNNDVVNQWAGVKAAREVNTPKVDVAHDYREPQVQRAAPGDGGDYWYILVIVIGSGIPIGLILGLIPVFVISRAHTKMSQE